MYVLPICTAFFSRIPIQSLKILDQNAIYLGKLSYLLPPLLSSSAEVLISPNQNQYGVCPE